MKDYLKIFLTSEPSSVMIFDFGSCVPSAFLQTTGRLWNQKGRYIHPESRKRFSSCRFVMSWILLFGPESESEYGASPFSWRWGFPRKSTSEQGAKCVGDKHVTIFSSTPSVRISKPLNYFGFESPPPSSRIISHGDDTAVTLKLTSSSHSHFTVAFPTRLARLSN